jgi:rhomboid protease GluP
MFEHGTKECFIIEDLIAAFLIREKLHQAIGRIYSGPQRLHDKIDVLGRELHPAIRNYHVHSILPLLTIDTSDVEYFVLRTLYTLQRRLSLPETPHSQWVAVASRPPACYTNRVDTLAAIIPVRSRQQAMDWSLVLVSQGIECRIDPEAQDHGWQLAVAQDDLSRSIQALRLYHRENKQHIWSQVEPWTGLTFDWRATAWFALLAIIYLLGQSRYPFLKSAGLMVSAKVTEGEWWRLFTAVMLHADPPHLLSNVTIGLIFLGFAMGSFGPGVALLTSFLAGVLGNVAGYILYNPAVHRGLGASGMVMGSLGLLAVHTFWRGRGTLTRRQAGLRGFAAGCFLLILLGTSQGTDVLAHAGGFVAGAVLGTVLCFFPEKQLHRPALNRLSELATSALVMLTWWLALKHG